MSSDRLPTFDGLSSDLGPDLMQAIGRCITSTREDFHEYRKSHPDWVAQATERGLANWIHDRMWNHLDRSVSEQPEVLLIDNGVLREMRVGTRYRFRAKRHDSRMAVRSYPTQSALEFRVQETLSPDLSEVRLDIGYEWLAEEREIGPAVMTLHHQEDLEWWAELDEESGGWGVRTFEVPTPGVPQAPGFSIDLGQNDRDKRKVVEGE